MPRLILQILISALVLCAGSAHAQAASDDIQRRELAQAIVKINYEILDQKSLTKNMLGQMQGQLRQMIEAPESRIPKDKHEEALKIVQDEMATYVERLAPAHERVRQLSVDLYAQKYSIDELKALYAFTNSDLGRKNLNVVAKELPALMGSMMQDLMPYAQEMSQRIQTRLKDLVK